MFIHTLESLEEFEDYIKQLEETVGLSTETYQEVTNAISRERDKLKNLSLFGVSGRSEQLIDFRCYQESSSTGRCKCLKEEDCEWADKN